MSGTWLGGLVHVHDDPDLEPAELAARLSGGDREALAEMYRRWSPWCTPSRCAPSGPARTRRTSSSRSSSPPGAAGRRCGRNVARPSPGSSASRSTGSPTSGPTVTGATANLQALASEAVTEPSAADDSEWAERLLLVHELERMGDPRATVLRMAFIEDRTQERSPGRSTCRSVPSRATSAEG